MAHPDRLTLERLVNEARSERELSRSSWERLRSVFGDRFDKAWRLVLEKRIKRYIFRPSERVVWVAVGQNGEHRILPAAEYCSCDDFYFRVIDGDAGVCYHLLAQRLAEALNSYLQILEEDEAYPALAAEWQEWTSPHED